MASAQSTALKHWARIIKLWPVDKVRPESIAFQTVMQQRIRNSTQPTTSAVDDSTKNAASTAGATASTRTRIRPWNEAKELREANALYNLLDDRFSKQFPTPQQLRYPASNPTHYDDMIREMEEAPSRSWFGNVMNRVRGSLRLS